MTNILKYFFLRGYVARLLRLVSTGLYWLQSETLFCMKIIYFLFHFFKLISCGLNHTFSSGLMKHITLDHKKSGILETRD